LTHKKGHFDTIDAFKKVLECGYDIELEIIGDGELREELQKYIQDSGVEDTVKLSGALPNQQVITKLKEADAFILSSKKGPNGDKEGTPTVLVEAQAIGLPCISTVHAGIPEMIPEENQQFLAEEGNVEQLSKKMEKLINLTPEELEEVAARGREKIEQDFNLTREVGKLISIYKKLI
jgi:glycosyltransferase involved in cell wall biosynthesis